MMADYSKIPSDTINDILCYATQGRPMGQFLTAVMEHDLFEAFARADETHIRCMFDLVAFVHNQVPASCHGSPEKVKEFMRKKRNEFLSQPTEVA